MARKWFGRRRATTKASAIGPTPITAAITTSRTKPVRRETSVQPPTDRMCLNTGSGPRGAAVVPGEAVRDLGGAADPLGDDVERAPLHLGEDAPDILADDAERHELDAGEEHHRDDERGIARHVGPEEEGADGEVDRGRDRQSGDQHAEIGPD